MNDLWLNINDKKVYSKHAGIYCKYFWFCKVFKVWHKENEHIQTYISKNKVYILRINVLGDLWCVIRFCLNVWIIWWRYTLNFVKFITEKDGKLELTVSIKDHTWFALNVSSDVCERLLNDIIGFNVEKNCDYCWD